MLLPNSDKHTLSVISYFHTNHRHGFAGSTSCQAWRELDVVFLGAMDNVQRESQRLLLDTNKVAPWTNILGLVKQESASSIISTRARIPGTGGARLFMINHRETWPYENFDICFLTILHIYHI